ncbi:8-amino-7-oxononanoate synthase [Pseudoruegeria aquimaris]|uniref:8-amino-7-oxononanoate synthase n=1 Tax=Pseudoruegeria aquimaris TaxID=393663 RepID=A0A1Y5SHJ9_9RHOB|nr:8-amino-7-oxononanoate synthase [Pseudoruegeria aquimaris]SLN37809.1 8-amino-7-oxononanoate synthase [Pseudoruegeria aquimaris]
MSLLTRHAEALASLEARGRRRSLIPAGGHDFASNDYLGLAQSPELLQAAQEALARGVPVGAGASRLLRGNHPEHEALEAEAAAFFGTQAALFMQGGFVANTAILSALPRQGDLILHDALIHASSHDGMRLGRAETQAFAHNDVQDAEDKLRAWREAGNTGLAWLCFESLYSMDGDLAPIDDLVALADRFGAICVVDEAHATGVFGDMGRGLSHPFADRENVLTLHTGGKGLGASGALVCGDARLIDTLINRARGFIFATAPAPLTAAILRASLALLQSQPERQARLQARIAKVRALCAGRIPLPAQATQILPVIIGGDHATMEAAAALQAQGFDIRGIRPPTVPRGTSRLRISLTLNPSDDAVAEMVAALCTVLEPA